MALSIPAVFLGWKGGKRMEFRGRACFRPARVAEEQVAHSAGREKMEEIFRCLEGWAGESMLCFLKPVEKSWQPQDLLPDSSNGDEGFFDRVKELRERARELPNDFFVCLVGNMVTEEALPTYQTFLNNLDGVRDETGASLSPWAVWTRAWTAEENRHGDLLKQYLFLSGRVDMRKVETTIQHLIACGMYVKTENNPYKGFIYTSFQERATFIAHRNTAREASRHGDTSLALICGAVAADEKRHCAAYAAVVEKLFEIDPDGAVLALADMMRKGIVMPGHLMFDGRDHSLFHHLGQATSQLGIYNAFDYADVIEYLLRRWKVESLAGLSGEGKAAQEFVCSLPPRIRRLHSINLRRSAALSPISVPFSWIFDRHLQF